MHTVKRVVVAIAALVAATCPALFEACGGQHTPAPGGGSALDGSATDGSTPDGSAGTDSDIDASADASADVAADATSDGGCPYDYDAPPDVARGPACSHAQEQQAWAAMVTQPIVLPNRAAGLDLAGAGDAGITLAQAEEKLCTSLDYQDLFGDCSRVAAWPPASNVFMDYDPATGIGRFLLVGLFGPGYTGALGFKSPSGGSSYSIAPYTQIQKDGQPFMLEKGWSGTAFESEVDELYRGIVATFAPSVPLDPPGTTCVATKKCVVGQPNNQLGFVFIDALGFAFWVTDFTSAQPAPSTPTRLDVYRR